MKTKKKTNKTQPTLVCLLLDRSGSMASVKGETIGGYNGYIRELKRQPGLRFTLTQFDSLGVDIIHDGKDIAGVPELTDKTYEPRGNTPLYDAIGCTVKAAEKQAGDSKVLFVIQTDGQENCSSDWTLGTIQTLIKEREDRDKWTFVYLGMGPNGWSAMNTVAYRTKSAANNVKFDKGSTVKMYSNLGKKTMMYARSSKGGQHVNCCMFTEDEKDLTK